MRKVFACFLFFIPLFSHAQVSESQLIKDITYLASDKLKGRSPGSKGEKLAYQYIIKHLKTHGLQAKGSNGFLQPFTYTPKLHPHDTSGSGEERKGHNVVAYLDNGAAQTIVFGAHYDHLGVTGEGSSLDANPHGKIHNGADDNASGVAGVMALAQHYATNNVKEPCNMVFAFFSAEEAGLIGSKYLCEHPTWDLKTTKAMINFDMIGRLKSDSNFLMVYGTGTSPSLENILQEENRNRFVLRLDSSGIGPSDQTSFYLKNIPVLHFFTGQHKQYHKPEDDSHLINYKGEAAVLNYVLDVANAMMAQENLPFTATRNKQSDNVRMKVTMGVMPDYSYSGKGMRLDGVTEGKPAANAGMKAGDILIKLAGKEINDIYGYMNALQDMEKGKSTEAVLLRDGKEMILKVSF